MKEERLIGNSGVQEMRQQSHDAVEEIRESAGVMNDVFHLEESEEYVEASTDNNGRFLEGTKEDGTKEFGVNVKVNKNLSVEGGIDTPTAGFSSENVPGYLNVELDVNNKVLGGRREDGIREEMAGIKTPLVDMEGGSFKDFDDPEERSEIVLDSNERVLSYRKKDGTKVEKVGLESSKIFTDELKLSESGMIEFQKELKNSGFNPGGAGDFSDKDYMYIPEPRLAHLNIITDFDLTTLSKTSDVKCQVEFTDGAGNYFKKWMILNGQGRSSLNYVKKGLGIDFFNENPNSPDFDEDNTFKIKFGDWVAQDSFHCKSFYTDFPRCTCPVVYKLANEVFETRGLLEDRPFKKYYVGNYTDAANKNSESNLSQNMETGARCVPDGFPVIVYQNGEFWGVNSLQLKKHRDNYMLNKKKDSNIHLDGDMGLGVGYETCFWDWNGNIDWAHFCSGTYGIEIRNPKNLYCVDGKKYDADTHDVEIITTAIAEEWIAAGQIIPTGKTIDDTLAGYLRTTGKVRKSIEDLTTIVPYVQSLIDDEAPASDIKAALEATFDISSFIDYILIQNVVGNYDAWDNNGQFVTWGKLSGSTKLNWSVNVYDCDTSFGCDSGGQWTTPANNAKYGKDYPTGKEYPLFKIFWAYYFDELKSRYQYLRRKGIFDCDHIIQLFRNWMNRVGYDNYVREFEKWPESPCFRDGNQTYTLNPQTGGFYGSIERIYIWTKKRIEFMDAADFFDYNQN